MSSRHEMVDSLKVTLTTIADECHTLSPYLGYASTINQDIKKITTTMTQVDKYTSELDKCAKGLEALCYSLSAIPVVGAVISKVPSVIKPLDAPIKGIKDLAQASTPVLKTIKTSSNTLAKECAIFQKDAQFADAHFRNYANSLDILNSCLDLLDELSQLISSDKAKSRLTVIVTDLEKEIQTISNDIAKAKAEIQSIKNTMKQLETDFKKASDPFLSVANTFTKACQSVTKFLSPITNAFNKILNAIAPLKWLLKALGWLFKKIINPIIDSILKVLGLDKLLNKISQEIQKLLHIDELKNYIESIENKIGEKTVVQLTKQLNSIKTKLAEQENKLKNLLSLDAFEQELVHFLEESYQEWRDQELPDWPELTSIQSVTVYCQPYAPEKYILPVESDGMNYSINLPAINIDDLTLAQSIYKMNQLVQKLNAIYEQWQSFESNLHLCEKYAKDIFLFSTLVDHLDEFLDALTDMPYFEVLNSLIQSIKQKLTEEKGKVTALKSSMDDCLQSYDQTLNQLTSLYETLPGQKEIDSLYQVLTNIDDSYQSTCSLLSYSESDQRQQILDAVNQKHDHYMAQLGTFDQAADNSQQELNDLVMQLDDITKNIQQLSNDENEIIDSVLFHNLSNVDQYLDGIHALLLPTKQILSFIQNKQHDQSEKYIQMMQQFINKASAFLDTIVQSSIFNDFLQLVLPFDTITTQIKDLNHEISQIDLSQIKMITQKLNDVTQSVQPSCSYDDGSGNTVYNLYLDQNMCDSLVTANMKGE